MEQIRQQLSADDFAAFRQDSASFMRGDIDAAALHRRVTQLNVAAAVPELAALCPDAGDVTCAQLGSHADGTHADFTRRPLHIALGPAAQGYVPVVCSRINSHVDKDQT